MKVDQEREIPIMKLQARIGPSSGILMVLILGVALMFGLSSCRSRSTKSLSPRAKVLKLTSSFTEIAVQSAKVQGYWASQIADGERFFLFLWDRENSFKEGDVLEVEGAFGPTFAAVFDENTRIYVSDAPINLFLAWRAKASSSRRPCP